jgi:hypothetical protein
MSAHHDVRVLSYGTTGDRDGGNQTCRNRFRRIGGTLDGSTRGNSTFSSQTCARFSRAGTDLDPCIQAGEGGQGASPALVATRAAPDGAEARACIESNIQTRN